MSISGINASSATAILGLQSSSSYAVEKTDYSNEISDEFSESDETSKFKGIVDKYDITNMSSNEFVSMYKELYDNKLIDFKEYAISTSIVSLKQGPIWKEMQSLAGGKLTIAGAPIPDDPNEKTNFLDVFKIRADYAKKYSDSKSQNVSDDLLNLAEKIHYFQSEQEG